MVAYCAGDAAAFRELFARYAGPLHRILSRFRLSHEQLSDLVQQTFLQLHRARLDFDANCELRPWLLTIAFNLAREQLRRNRRKPESCLDLVAPQGLGCPPDELLRAELRRDLSNALQQLPDDQREVVRLHFVEDLSFEEIGARVEASEGAVRVRAHRGYVALRKLLTARSTPENTGTPEGSGS